MKEKLIKYFEYKERQMEQMPEERKAFFDHCFGAIDFVMGEVEYEEMKELLNLWVDEWQERLGEKVNEAH